MYTLTLNLLLFYSRVKGGVPQMRYRPPRLAVSVMWIIGAVKAGSQIASSDQCHAGLLWPGRRLGEAFGGLTGVGGRQSSAPR
jgi:hypothetical protein